MGRIKQLMVEEVCGSFDGKPPKSPRTGLVLGTGWADQEVLQTYFRSEEHPVIFEDLALGVPGVAGHAGRFLIGRWRLPGKDQWEPVVISQGRVHRNQCLQDPELLTRWLSSLLVLMGDGWRLLLTNAVGGLQPHLAVGSISVPTSAVYHHLTWPELHPGEFFTPEALLPPLDSPFNLAANRAAREADLEVFGNTCYTMIQGPAFGGRGDRQVLGKLWGCHTVGMSILPELALLAVENAEKKRRKRGTIHVGVVQLVTDNQDAPTHEDNQAQAKKLASKLGKLVTSILAAKW